MSNDYNFSDDLDSILSEFSNYSKSLEGVQEEPVEEKKPAAPYGIDEIIADTAKFQAAPAPKEEKQVSAAAERNRAEEKTSAAEKINAAEKKSAVSVEKPEAPAEKRPVRRERTAAPETDTGSAGTKLVKRGIPLMEHSAKAEEPVQRREVKKEPAKRTEPVYEKPAPTAKEKPRRKLTEKPKEEPVPEKPKKEPKERKKLTAAQRVGGGVLGTVFMVISIFVLAWVGFNVHPNASSAAATASGTKISLPDKLDGYMNNLASDALGELTYIKKIYTLQESDNAGPVPNEACYGTASIENAAEVMQVVEKARASGLLDGQEVMFNPDINFYYDSEIKYYCDETILAICWKELIDGNTVSCCEVKIADASQFRRKIADDTYGSPNQYYASSLSKQANAVVAMNADFYQFRDFGIVVYQRELYRYSDSNYTGMYSLYNCIDNCFVTAGGDFIFMHRGDTITEEELRQFIVDNDILFSIAFGPILVENGEVQPCTWYAAGEPTTGYSRAGIGVVDKLHYFYMNLNHSPEKAARWTVTEFAEHMHEKGIDTAYGLDGGQTGELVYKHEPYNYIDFGSERLVSDIIYFATAIPSEEAQQ